MLQLIKCLRDEVSREESHARTVEGESLTRGKGLGGQLDQLKQDIKANEARHAEIVKGHEEKFAAVTAQLTQVTADLEKAKLEIDKDEHLLQDRKEEHDHDIHEIHDVRSKLGNAEASIVQKNKQIANLEVQVSEWESKYEDIAVKLTSKEEEAKELDNFLSATKMQVSKYEGDLKETTAKMKAVEEGLKKGFTQD